MIDTADMRRLLAEAKRKVQKLTAANASLTTKLELMHVGLQSANELYKTDVGALTAENAALRQTVAEAREAIETAQAVSIDLLDFIDEHASVYFACVLEDNYGNRLRALAGKAGE